MRQGGNLEGLISRLDYLKNLGITAIWLNPVLENNFRNSYHGYAATDLYKIDPRFGSNGDYKRLVKEAQQRGIKVIFDHIANHIGTQHPWLSNLPTDTWLNGSADDHLTGKHYKMDFRDPYADPFSYDVVVGNIDGMAGADLVWVASSRDSNPVHRDLTTGGTPALIVAGDNQNVAEGEGPFELRLLDVNGDGRKDLLLNHMGTVNRSFIGLGTSSGEFDFSPIQQDHPAFESWSQYEILVGDVDGDRREDVIYNSAGASNKVYVGLAKD